MSRLGRALPVALVVLSWGALLSETVAPPVASGDVTLLGDVEEPPTTVQEFPSSIPEGGTGGTEEKPHSHLALGPDNAVPQDKETDLLTRKAVSQITRSYSPDTLPAFARSRSSAVAAWEVLYLLH